MEIIHELKARGLSYIQADNHNILLFYTTYISVDLAHHEIFRDNVGKGGINIMTSCVSENGRKRK